MMMNPLHIKFLHLIIITWTASACLILVFRDRKRIEVQTPNGSRLNFEFLNIFPFTSESKRMGNSSSAHSFTFKSFICTFYNTRYHICLNHQRKKWLPHGVIYSSPNTNPVALLGLRIEIISNPSTTP